MDSFHPLVREWFAANLGAPTQAQTEGWREIHDGRDTLIAAPTGSGKTLAAFLVAIDGLVRRAVSGSLSDSIDTLYVSPLKALSNDIHKNLEIPLAGIAGLAASRGIPMAPIRAAVRTSDTPAHERRKTIDRPPHILVTTPESLFILLTAEHPREKLRTVRTVIVDEIHALAGDKRGSHLALSLERLESIAATRPRRIGLSATVKPAAEVGRFLSPDAAISDAGQKRALDIEVEIPADELGPIASNELWAAIHDRLAALIREHQTTLVFVNTRRLSERVAHALSERLGEGAVLPHHGSLARHLRLDAESRLKSGDLRAVVATASLELGIDIGSVDLVCQVGSPRRFSSALQRIGRSRHQVGRNPKGRLLPTTRDEMIECAAIVDGLRSGDLERIEIPGNALDILAQQLVAETACADWSEDALFDLCRRAFPYRDLRRQDFDAVVRMLSEGIATNRGRSGAYLHRDQVNHRLRARRGARLAAITSGGAIPENAAYQVILEPEGKQIGTLDEDFAIESMAGDIFTLGTHSWKIRRVEPGRVRVEDAKGAPPSIPFWLGEAPGRSGELSAVVSRVRTALAGGTLPGEVLCEAGSRQAAAYLNESAKVLGALPSAETVIAERFFDEAGGMQLVLHAPFGSRITRAWGLALRKRFCRTFNFELQAAATDNGLVLSLGEQHSFPLELVFEFLKPETVEDVLRQALLASPMFGARWRWNATRSLAVLRFRGGRRVPAPIQRMQSDDLMAAVFPDQAACAENLTGPPQIPDHPLVNETIANCLREAMDIDGLKRVLEAIEDGRIRTLSVDTPAPSPLCHEILNANPYAFLDDAPLEERRARAVALRRTLPAELLGGAGLLDAAAIAEVSAEVWPDPRNADELHDALLTLIVLPPVPEWQPLFDTLAAAGRAHATPHWIATERGGLLHDTTAIVRGWFDCLGPTTPESLAARLTLDLGEVRAALAELEAQGQLLRGHFTTTAAEEWCHRRILARIHRLTLGRLRREIEPVSPADLHRFLCRWHHVSPGSQLHGADGLLHILRQLQGYEIAASSWESPILSARVAHYEPGLLDELCLSGEVMWGRLSARPTVEEDEVRRVRPTRSAPVGLFLREDAAWLLPEEDPARQGLSHAARDVLAVLESRGASFFGELATAAHHLPTVVEDALWELASAGLVTADGFENLRALIDPKRRAGHGRHRGSRPRHAAGRWALLRRDHPPAPHARIERFARQLLARWGILFRDLLARETLSPPWRDLLPVLRSLEARGEIRGGRFVSGLSGEQFAQPEALELLRAVRRAAAHPEDQLAIPHADPLNLSGIVLPGPRLNPLIAGAWSLAERLTA